MFLDFRGEGREIRGEVGEREGERNIDVREKTSVCASCMHTKWGPNLLGISPPPLSLLDEALTY